MITEDNEQNKRKTQGIHELVSTGGVYADSPTRWRTYARWRGNIRPTWCYDIQGGENNSSTPQMESLSDDTTIFVCWWRRRRSFFEDETRRRHRFNTVIEADGWGRKNCIAEKADEDMPTEDDTRLRKHRHLTKDFEGDLADEASSGEKMRFRRAT